MRRGKKIMDINLNTVYYLSHRVVKEMVKQKSGKIINIASALAFTADKKMPALYDQQACHCRVDESVCQ